MALPGFKPGRPDQEINALTTQPPRLKGVDLVWFGWCLTARSTQIGYIVPGCKGKETGSGG